MRVQTLLNQLLRLPGLWVRGVRLEQHRLIIQIRRRFHLLCCPECGTKVRGRFEEKIRQWRHLAVWGLRPTSKGRSDAYDAPYARGCGPSASLGRGQTATSPEPSRTSWRRWPSDSTRVRSPS